jgi:hypothetical protein
MNLADETKAGEIFFTGILISERWRRAGESLFQPRAAGREVGSSLAADQALDACSTGLASKFPSIGKIGIRFSQRRPANYRDSAKYKGLAKKIICGGRHRRELFYSYITCEK